MDTHLDWADKAADEIADKIAFNHPMPLSFDLRKCASIIRARYQEVFPKPNTTFQGVRQGGGLERNTASEERSSHETGNGICACGHGIWDHVAKFGHCRLNPVCSCQQFTAVITSAQTTQSTEKK